MITEKYRDYYLKYDNSPEAAAKCYEMCLNWFKKHGLFHGECIIQCDRGWTESPELVAQIADKVFKFETSDE